MTLKASDLSPSGLLSVSLPLFQTEYFGAHPSRRAGVARGAGIVVSGSMSLCAGRHKVHVTQALAMRRHGQHLTHHLILIIALHSDGPVYHTGGSVFEPRAPGPGRLLLAKGLVGHWWASLMRNPLTTPSRAPHCHDDCYSRAAACPARLGGLRELGPFQTSPQPHPLTSHAPPHHGTSRPAIVPAHNHTHTHPATQLEGPACALAQPLASDPTPLTPLAQAHPTWRPLAEIANARF